MTKKPGKVTSGFPEAGLIFQQKIARSVSREPVYPTRKAAPQTYSGVTLKAIATFLSEEFTILETRIMAGR